MPWVKQLILSCALAILAAPCFAADDSDTYTIHLDRPSHKGGAGAFEVVYAQVMTGKTTWQGHDPMTTEDALGAHLICAEEVQEVDETGHSVLVTFTVRTFTSVKDKDETVLLPPGTKIIAKPDGSETEFTIDGKAPEKNVQMFLKSVISLVRAKDMPSFDKAYGTLTPRRIGEVWAIDPEPTTSYMKTSGLIADVKDVSGDMTFKALETSEDGEPFMRVEGNAHVKYFAYAKHTLPASSVKLKDAKLDSHSTWLAPIDPEKHLCSMVSEVTFEYTWTGERQGLSYETIQTVQTEKHIRALKE
jgi:hypothetical protein